MKALILLIVAILAYSLIGTSYKVEEIKQKAEIEIPKRNWEIVRYEGFQFGSWGNNGGKVWYHVKDKTHRNTYYRVFVTMWGGELQYNYGEPESLNRINLDS